MIPTHTICIGGLRKVPVGAAAFTGLGIGGYWCSLRFLEWKERTAERMRAERRIQKDGGVSLSNEARTSSAAVIEAHEAAAALTETGEEIHGQTEVPAWFPVRRLSQEEYEEKVRQGATKK